jgi:cyclophilin family peptidyl-prolyl cis-trans isomerase
MSNRANEPSWATQGWVATALSFLVLVGCEPGQPAVDRVGGEKSEGAAASAAPSNAVAVDPRMQQTFEAATRQDPPADWQRPPDVTLAGKSVGKLYSDVVKLWDSFRLFSGNGQIVTCTATIDTELGPIEIALRPDLAPNHVRSFLILAHLGYYDGLVFERTVHAKSDEQPDVEVEVIEAGCPLGTGDSGVGSIGYWLKPEFSKEAHEAGTIGACHGVEPDTAACRFYITLNKAPFLDGNFTVFGKVTDGMEVVRKIYSLPVRNDPEYPEGDRPQKPVVIRKVTVKMLDPSAPR